MTHFQLTQQMRLLASSNNNNKAVSSGGPLGNSSHSVTGGPSPSLLMRPTMIAQRPTESVGGAVAQPPPKFTILKRPSQANRNSPAMANGQSNNPFDEDNKDSSQSSPTIDVNRDQMMMTGSGGGPRRAPVKSLEQRKQEYAEARLRILGDAKFSDDDDDEGAKEKAQEVVVGQNNTNKGKGQQQSNNNNNVGMRNNGRNNNYNNNKGGGGSSSGAPQMMTMSNHHHHHHQTNNTSSPSFTSRPPPAVFNASVPPPRFDPVIRVPRGPDGSVGFTNRR